MKKDHDEFNEKPEYEEPSLEDFLAEEEDDEETIKRKKKRKKLIKVTAVLIALGLILQGAGSLLTMFNLDAIDFLKTSYRLSQQEDVQQYKQAVVVVQGDRSRGTGFSVSENGLIITNEHVIRDQLSIGVSFPNGDMFVAELMEAYPELDIAFLKVDGENLPTLPLSNHRGEKDEAVYVIGNPLSFTQIANEGYVLESGGREERVTLIDAPIYKGNSGSPVINMAGEVVGVVYAKRRVQGSGSVGLVVPIEYVNEVIPTMR